MHRDVFGQHGDFTTSPEISQMFGEVCEDIISLFSFFSWSWVFSVQWLQCSALFTQNFWLWFYFFLLWAAAGLIWRI